MKWIAFSLLIIGIILCTGCTSFNSSTTPQVTTPAAPMVSGMPNLVGNWTGTFLGYRETPTGYQVFHDPMTMNVVEQDDRLFKGQVFYPVNGTIVTKDFAGVMSRDGKSFETIEYPDGFSDGVIISADEIEMIFRDTTDPSRIAIDTLTRSK